MPPDRRKRRRTVSRRRPASPLLLAQIPAERPCEGFAYLLFGNWKDCPETGDLMAAAKRWYEKYAAMPAVASGNTLEFLPPERWRRGRPWRWPENSWPSAPTSWADGLRRFKVRPFWWGLSGLTLRGYHIDNSQFV